MNLFDRTGKTLWDFFASLKLCVFLFVSITLFSIAGSFLPDTFIALRYLETKPEIFRTFFFFMGMDDFYSSWFFVLLIILLGVNIICCSFERLPRIFKIVLKKPAVPSQKRIEALKNKIKFQSEKSFDEVIGKSEKYLRKKRLKIYSSKNPDTYFCSAEKGRWTRLGVYITHFGFLLLIAGGVTGALGGFNGTIDISENATGSIVNLFKNKGQIELPFSVTCNSFEIKTYKNSQIPKSFESELVFDKGKVDEIKKRVKVNSPVKYKGIRFIQSGYGKALQGDAKIGVYDIKNGEKKGEYIVGEGESFILPDKKTRFTLFYFTSKFQVSGFELGETFICSAEKDGKVEPVALPVKNPLFDKHRSGDFYLRVLDFKTVNYTSLQVSKDNGVPVVYAGFIFLLCGCFISFFMCHKSYFLMIKKTDDYKTEVLFGISSDKRKEFTENEPEELRAFL